MNTEPQWVLVADASRARLFHGTGDELVLESTLDHPGSRARVRDLMADANGRKPAGPTRGPAYGGNSISEGVGRTGAAPTTDPKEVEAQKFAHELCDLLAERTRDEANASVVLVAPPQFLGLLRQTLDKQVAKRVRHSIDKHLVNLDAKQLIERLRSELTSN